jgi:hypothetical protein
MARIATAQARRRERRGVASRPEGEFPWLRHQQDEFRVDLEGSRPGSLGSGDLFVVPKDLGHRPVAHARPCAPPRASETKRTGMRGERTIVDPGPVTNGG